MPRGHLAGVMIWLMPLSPAPPPVSGATVLALASACVGAQQLQCEPYCHNPCEQLRGRLDLECGACQSGPEKTGCFPGAPGWRVGDASICEKLKQGMGSTGRFGQTSRLRSLASPPARAPDSCAVGQAKEGAGCDDAENTARLGERGWVVLRGLMPLDEVDRLISNLPPERLCDPNVVSCHLSGAQIATELPRFRNATLTLLGGWEAGDVAKTADLGHSLGFLHNSRAGRPIHITSAATREKLRRERKPFSASWHVDNTGADGQRGHHHRLWVMLRKGAGEGTSLADVSSQRTRTNLCVVSTSEFDRCTCTCILAFA